MKSRDLIPVVLSVAWLTGSALMAQLSQAATQGTSQPIQLTVTVEDKGGTPVENLRQQDFTVMDNKSAAEITSFKSVTAQQEPVHVILLIDAVNPPFNMVAYERDGVEKYLKANGGKLAYPTTFAVLTDKGTQIEKTFSSDGNGLSKVLAHYNQGLRQIHRDSEWGGSDRLQISLTAMRQMVAFGQTMPGRKLVIWISPGWPLLTGPRIDLDNAQEKSLFAEVVESSTELRQANITMYDVNPIGAGESLMRADYYKEYVKGVRSPADVQIASLGLQVLAVQSGGMSFESNSDVTGLIGRCVKDAQSWYEITVEPAHAEKPNEFHEIQVKVDKPGLEPRTRNGYYTQR
jgi:VWFA-related protein